MQNLIKIIVLTNNLLYICAKYLIMKKNKKIKEKLVFLINNWELTENQAKMLFNKTTNTKLPLPIVTVEGKKSKYIYEKNKIDVFFN